MDSGHGKVIKFYVTTWLVLFTLTYVTWGLSQQVSLRQVCHLHTNKWGLTSAIPPHTILTVTLRSPGSALRPAGRGASKEWFSPHRKGRWRRRRGGKEGGERLPEGFTRQGGKQKFHYDR
jgi:hypothetical protein